MQRDEEEEVIEIEMDVDIEGVVPSDSESEMSPEISVEPVIKFEGEESTTETLVAEDLSGNDGFEEMAEAIESTQNEGTAESPNSVVTESEKYKPRGRQAVKPESFLLECSQMYEYYVKGVVPGTNAKARGRFKERARRYTVDEFNILRFNTKKTRAGGKQCLLPSLVVVFAHVCVHGVCMSFCRILKLVVSMSFCRN